MNSNTENTDSSWWCKTILPKSVFQSFKIHSPRNNCRLNTPFHFIIENEKFRKTSVLQSQVQSTTERLFNLSNSSMVVNSLVHININHNLKDNLEPDERNLYTRCLEYIKKKDLPDYYRYFVFDFIASTSNKFLHLTEKEIFVNIATRYVFNVHSVLSGISSPVSKDCVYNTLPRAFSPLFFEKIQFAGAILHDKKIRKDFDNCLILGFIEHIRTATRNILLCNNKNDLDYIIDQTMDSINNLWWVPEQVITKIKQITIYTKNSFSKNSNLLGFLMVSYMLSECAYGLDENRLKEINISSSIRKVKNYIDKSLRTASYEVVEGWLMFDSIPHLNGFIFKTLKDLSKTLSKLQNLEIKYLKPIHLLKKYKSKRFKLFRGLLPNVFISIA